MSMERFPVSRSSKLGEAATCKESLHVRQEGVRLLEQFKVPAPEREKGGKP